VCANALKVDGKALTAHGLRAAWEATARRNSRRLLNILNHLAGICIAAVVQSNSTLEWKQNEAFGMNAKLWT
jgi:hypothetical protein